MSQSVNFNMQSAYFWLNQNIDLDEKLKQLKEQLSQASEQKRKKLKSKQTYLSSQNKNKEEKIAAQKTIEMALEELSEIWQQVDKLYE